jgi:Holliday junction resolvase-like predicted endonuclease
MSEQAVEDMPAEEAPAVDVDLKAVEACIADVAAKDKTRAWGPAERLQLGRLAWTPDAIGKKNAVLQVALIGDLPRYLGSRLRAAHADGHVVHVAVTTAVLYTPEWLDLLVEVDAFVYVVDDWTDAMRFKRRHVLAAIADMQVPVSPDQRQRLGVTALDMLGDGSSQDRGRRLEALLAFLFSQVTDFRVVRRNHRNKSQEIDLVLQIDSYSERVWQNPGRPLVLVEAKNRKEPTGAPVLAGLVRKIQTKRQTVKIAFLVSTSGVTKDLEIESLRGSTEDHCVVVIGPGQLRSLLQDPYLDDSLEKLVLDALID